MAILTGPLQVTGQDLYTTDSVKNHPLGSLIVSRSGNYYRYVLAGASDLVAGNLIQEAVEDTQFENMTVGTAGVAGDAYIQVTNGTTTVVPNQYIDGSISIYTAGTSLIGEEYTITDVQGTLTTGGALKVYLDRPLRLAITTAATVNMKPSPWAGVIQAPITTQTGMAVGVAIYPIKATQYGWIQSHGVCNVLSSNGTFAVGSDIGTPCADAAGAVTVFAAGTTHQRVGVVRQPKASGKGIVAFLQID